MFAGLAARPAAATVNPAPACTAPASCGNVYYTDYTGSVGYFGFTYNPSIPPGVGTFTFTTSPTTLVSALPHGADGIIFNPNTPAPELLLVGTNDNSNNFYQINPYGATPNGCPTTACTDFAVTGIPTTPPYNLQVDAAPSTTLYMNSDPGTLASVTLSSLIGSGTVSVAGTSYSLVGEVSLNTVEFTSPTTGFYTSELAPRFAGLTGHVGTVVINTVTKVATATCFKTAGVCTVFNGVHGLSFDPLNSKYLFAFGANQINQIDSTTGALVANEAVISPTGLVFDQGSVDGQGHLLLASNNGIFYFEDYTTRGATGTVATTNFHFTTNAGGAFQTMDDIAPLVGSGSPQHPVPEFPLGMVALLAIAVPLMLVLRTKHSAKSPVLA
jgi:hypothetical protein